MIQPPRAPASWAAVAATPHLRAAAGRRDAVDRRRPQNRSAPWPPAAIPAGAPHAGPHCPQGNGPSAQSLDPGPGPWRRLPANARSWPDWAAAVWGGGTPQSRAGRGTKGSRGGKGRAAEGPKGDPTASSHGPPPQGGHRARWRRGSRGWRAWGPGEVCCHQKGASQPTVSQGVSCIKTMVSALKVQAQRLPISP